LLAVGDTLVAGLSGRLVGFNPSTGASRWEVPIASSRGTNDVERLVDLVAPVSRHGNVICARAFQATVGCVNADQGQFLWSKPAFGYLGLAGDDKSVYGVESDGKIIAWRGADGERTWTSERLRYHSLSAPMQVGRSVVVGDSTGWVHWLSRDDGSHLTRMSTDGSSIVATPVLAAGTVVVVTHNGGIFGFKPE
jgi:outer membrane protein assembly factor BamB